MRRERAFNPNLEKLGDRVLLSGITTYRGDQGNVGNNAAETVLTPANVNPSTFGKLFSVNVDGQMYAQPLYVPGVSITTGARAGVHDVIIAATENDSVYALDAVTGAPLWQESLLIGLPGAVVTPVPDADVNAQNISPLYGITSTPVVDESRNLVYVVTETKEVVGGISHYIFRIHALSLSNGSEQLGGPVTIADTSLVNGQFVYNSGPSVAGTGDGAVNGVVNFNVIRQLQRSALTLANGSVYVAFASQNDTDPYHGWLLSFDASNLKMNGVFNDTPNGAQGGIWMAGGKPAVDAQGNLYLSTGNGTFDSRLTATGFPSLGDYGDSILKISVDPSTTPVSPGRNGWGLKVTDYFSPHNQAYYDANDLDVASAGVILLPDSAGSAAAPHLLMGSTKDGTIFLINRDNMGKFHPRIDHIVGELLNVLPGDFSLPGYFNNTIYYAGVGNGATPGIAIRVQNAKMAVVANTPDGFYYPGSTPTISSNGANNGVVWMLDSGTGELRAYNAANLGQELYNSNMAGTRDTLGWYVKFTVPDVYNGRVYVGGNGVLTVYGLLGSSPSGVVKPPVPARVAIGPVGDNLQLEYPGIGSLPGGPVVQRLEQERQAQQLIINSLVAQAAQIGSQLQLLRSSGGNPRLIRRDQQALAADTLRIHQLQVRQNQELKQEERLMAPKPGR